MALLLSLSVPLSSWPLHVIICFMSTITMSNNWDDEWE